MTLTAQQPNYGRRASPSPARSGVKLWAGILFWGILLFALAAGLPRLTSPTPENIDTTIVTVPPTAPVLVAGQNPIDQALPPAQPGLKPLVGYAYPFNKADERPKVAVVLRDVGPQQGPLKTALARLPGAVGLALSATTPKLAETLTMARAAGHETLIEVGVESVDSQAVDPGPGALRRNLTVEENITRLQDLLGRAAEGYVGLVLPPSALIDNSLLMDALLDLGRSRGLLWLATGEGMSNFAEAGRNLKAPVLADELIRIDGDLTPAAVDAALANLESLARLKGRVVAVSAPYPMVVERLNRWLPTLEDKGLVLAPVSALVPPTLPPS